jgi:hypothetical protein
MIFWRFVIIVQLVGRTVLRFMRSWWKEDFGWKRTKDIWWQANVWAHFWARWENDSNILVHTAKYRLKCFQFFLGRLDSMGAFHLMDWPVRPEFFSLYQWNDLIHVSQISSENGRHVILMLSKFSGQISPKPKFLCSIQQFDRSDRSGRVNRKRPYVY